MTTPKPEPQQQGKKTTPIDALLAGVREFAASTDEQTGTEALLAGVKQYLAELPDKDFAALVAEVRPPADTTTTDDGGPAYPPEWGYTR
jgi:hypothetical protein